MFKSAATAALLLLGAAASAANAQCPNDGSSDTRPDVCTRCLDATTAGGSPCYFTTITGIGSPRYCCESTPSGCGISGGSRSSVSGSPQGNCDCDTISGTSVDPSWGLSSRRVFGADIPPAGSANRFGLKHFALTGPGTFEAYPDDASFDLEVYARAEGSTRPVDCAAYSPNATSEIQVAVEGSFRSVDIPAGNHIVSVVTTPTGVPPASTISSPAFQAVFCLGSGGCDPSPCNGACDLTKEWCASDAPGFRTCCPLGEQDTAGTCRSGAGALAASLLTVAAALYAIRD